MKKKRKRAGGRAPRSSPAHPTRAKVLKGGEPRQSRDPFQTKWTYLDTSRLGTTPKVAATKRGGAGKDDKGAARRPITHNAVKGVNPSRAQAVVSYYEPPPLPKPFYLWTPKEIAVWLSRQDEAYQRTAAMLAVDAGVLLIEHERRRGAAPCEDCGYDGTPAKAHRWNCTTGVIKNPPPRSFKKAEPVDDEDGDIPF